MMYPSSYPNTFKNGFYDGVLDFEQNHLHWINRRGVDTVGIHLVAASKRGTTFEARIGHPDHTDA